MTTAPAPSVENFHSAADSAYLAELKDRITILRSLHKQMARRDKTLNWLKPLSKKT